MSLERIALAYETAARAHAGQTRKGRAGIPYINHPVEVARMVAATGAPEDVVIAAVLHDVVEDSDVTLAELERAFGPEVAALVDALTDDPDWERLSTPERKRRQAGEMPRAPGAARAIKIADQASNLGDLAREPEAWKPTEVWDYLAASCAVVDACRGASPDLEARFDEAAAGLRRVMAARGRGAA